MLELFEEPNFGSSQSNLDEEQAVISDVNSNNVDDETPAHIEGVHGSKKECSCHKMINSIEVKRHIREAHMGDTRECPECKKQIRTSKFSQHMQVVHSGIKEKCPRCEKEMSFKYLARHIKEVHDNVRKHCPFCPKKLRATVLKRHIKEVHDNVKRRGAVN